MVKRVVRSTRVAICDLPPFPMMRSPSQKPGTARSSASAGRSLILTMSGIFPLLKVALDRETRLARPCRNASFSSVRTGQAVLRSHEPTFPGTTHERSSLAPRRTTAHPHSSTIPPDHGAGYWVGVAFFSADSGTTKARSQVTSCVHRSLTARAALHGQPCPTLVHRAACDREVPGGLRGGLTAHLPMALRLLLVKADGSVSVHADDRAYKRNYPWLRQVSPSSRPRRSDLRVTASRSSVAEVACR